VGAGYLREILLMSVVGAKGGSRSIRSSRRRGRAKAGGIVMPSAFAVFRLNAGSDFVFDTAAGA
jgi:hypothetical protein